MTTKFIGIKDFRQNISNYAQEAQKNKLRLVIMNRNKPLFEVTPFSEESTYDSLYEEVVKAKSDVARGKFFTHEAVGKKLGL